MTRQSFNEMMCDKIRREAEYSENMVKIAILRVFILEDWPRDMLLFTALNDIKDDSCSEIREKLSAHGHICRFCQLEAFLWRGKHILTWDRNTFTAYDDPQFKLPDYPRDRSGPAAIMDAESNSQEAREPMVPAAAPSETSPKNSFGWRN